MCLTTIIEGCFLVTVLKPIYIFIKASRKAELPLLLHSPAESSTFHSQCLELCVCWCSTQGCSSCSICTEVLFSLKKFLSHRNLFTFGNQMSLTHQYVSGSTTISSKYVFKTLLLRIFKTKIHGIHDTEDGLKDGLEIHAKLSDTGRDSGAICLHSCYCQQKPGHSN